MKARHDAPDAPRCLIIRMLGTAIVRVIEPDGIQCHMLGGRVGDTDDSAMSLAREYVRERGWYSLTQWG